MAAQGTAPVSAENLHEAVDGLRGLLAPRETIFSTTSYDGHANDLAATGYVRFYCADDAYQSLEVTCRNGQTILPTVTVPFADGASADAMPGHPVTITFVGIEKLVNFSGYYSEDGIVRVVGVRSGGGQLVADLLDLLR